MGADFSLCVEEDSPRRARWLVTNDQAAAPPRCIFQQCVEACVAHVTTHSGQSFGGSALTIAVHTRPSSPRIDDEAAVSFATSLQRALEAFSVCLTSFDLSRCPSMAPWDVVTIIGALAHVRRERRLRAEASGGVPQTLAGTHSSRSASPLGAADLLAAGRMSRSPSVAAPAGATPLHGGQHLQQQWGGAGPAVHWRTEVVTAVSCVGGSGSSRWGSIHEGAARDAAAAASASSDPSDLYWDLSTVRLDNQRRLTAEDLAAMVDALAPSSSSLQQAQSQLPPLRPLTVSLANTAIAAADVAAIAWRAPQWLVVERDEVCRWAPLVPSCGGGAAGTSWRQSRAPSLAAMPPSSAPTFVTSNSSPLPEFANAFAYDANTEPLSFSSASASRGPSSAIPAEECTARGVHSQHRDASVQEPFAAKRQSQSNPHTSCVYDASPEPPRGARTGSDSVTTVGGSLETEGGLSPATARLYGEARERSAPPHAAMVRAALGEDDEAEAEGFGAAASPLFAADHPAEAAATAASVRGPTAVPSLRLGASSAPTRSPSPDETTRNNNNDKENDGCDTFAPLLQSLSARAFALSEFTARRILEWHLGAARWDAALRGCRALIGADDASVEGGRSGSSPIGAAAATALVADAIEPLAERLSAHKAEQLQPLCAEAHAWLQVGFSLVELAERTASAAATHRSSIGGSYSDTPAEAGGDTSAEAVADFMAQLSESGLGGAAVAPLLEVLRCLPHRRELLRSLAAEGGLAHLAPAHTFPPSTSSLGGGGGHASPRAAPMGPLAAAMGVVFVGRLLMNLCGPAAERDHIGPFSSAMGSSLCAVLAHIAHECGGAGESDGENAGEEWEGREGSIVSNRSPQSSEQFLAFARSEGQQRPPGAARSLSPAAPSISPDAHPSASAQRRISNSSGDRVREADEEAAADALAATSAYNSDDDGFEYPVADAEDEREELEGWRHNSSSRSPSSAQPPAQSAMPTAPAATSSATRGAPLPSFPKRPQPSGDDATDGPDEKPDARRSSSKNSRFPHYMKRLGVADGDCPAEAAPSSFVASTSQQQQQQPQQSGGRVPLAPPSLRSLRAVSPSSSPLRDRQESHSDVHDGRTFTRTETETSKHRDAAVAPEVSASPMGLTAAPAKLSPAPIIAAPQAPPPPRPFDVEDDDDDTDAIAATGRGHAVAVAVPIPKAKVPNGQQQRSGSRAAGASTTRTHLTLEGLAAIRKDAKEAASSTASATARSAPATPRRTASPIITNATSNNAIANRQAAGGDRGGSGPTPPRTGSPRMTNAVLARVERLRQREEAERRQSARVENKRFASVVAKVSSRRADTPPKLHYSSSSATADTTNTAAAAAPSNSLGYFGVRTKRGGEEGADAPRTVASVMGRTTLWDDSVTVPKRPAAEQRSALRSVAKPRDEEKVSATASPKKGRELIGGTDGRPEFLVDRMDITSSSTPAPFDEGGSSDVRRRRAGDGPRHNDDGAVVSTVAMMRKAHEEASAAARKSTDGAYCFTSAAAGRTASASPPRHLHARQGPSHAYSDATNSDAAALNSRPPSMPNAATSMPSAATQRLAEDFERLSAAVRGATYNGGGDQKGGGYADKDAAAGRSPSHLSRSAGVNGRTATEEPQQRTEAPPMPTHAPKRLPTARDPPAAAAGVAALLFPQQKEKDVAAALCYFAPAAGRAASSQRHADPLEEEPPRAPLRIVSDGALRSITNIAAGAAEERRAARKMSANPAEYFSVRPKPMST